MREDTTPPDRELGEEADRAMPVKISTPGSTEVFAGTASGSFYPALPVPTIVCKWWLHADSNGDPVGNPVETKNADITGRLTWSVSFDMTGMPPSSTDAVVRAEKGSDSDTHNRLSWTLGTAHLIAQASKIEGKLAGPPILVTRPRLNGKVGFLFLVHGEFDSSDHNRVEVQLLRADDERANALILPTVYLTQSKWVTSVFAFEGGEGYRVRATLKKKNGDTIIAHSAGNITIG